MMMDLFAVFDDHNKVSGSFFFIWFMVGLLTLSLVLFIFSFKGSGGSVKFMMTNVKDLVERSKMSKMGGSQSTVVCVFFCVLTLNFLGLSPYMFSITSHLVFNLALAGGLWISVVSLSMTYSMTDFLAHLQPVGSPSFLNPFLVLIELVSLLVRPITLSVRLAANLSTGHILMGLLASGFSSGSSSLMLMLISSVGIFYFMFEMAVCVIQSYIFTLLPNLYIDEHPEV